MLVIRVITAKCVILRCKVWKTILFTVVDLFTTPNFIALWINEAFQIWIWKGGTGKEPFIDSFPASQPPREITKYRCLKKIFYFSPSQRIFISNFSVLIVRA